MASASMKLKDRRLSPSKALGPIKAVQNFVADIECAVSCNTTSWTCNKRPSDPNVNQESPSPVSSLNKAMPADRERVVYKKSSPQIQRSGSLPTVCMAAQYLAGQWMKDQCTYFNETRGVHVADKATQTTLEPRADRPVASAASELPHKTKKKTPNGSYALMRMAPTSGLSPPHQLDNGALVVSANGGNSVPPSNSGHMLTLGGWSCGPVALSPKPNGRGSALSPKVVTTSAATSPPIFTNRTTVRSKVSSRHCRPKSRATTEHEIARLAPSDDYIWDCKLTPEDGRKAPVPFSTARALNCELGEPPLKRAAESPTPLLQRMALDGGLSPAGTMCLDDEMDDDDCAARAAKDLCYDHFQTAADDSGIDTASTVSGSVYGGARSVRRQLHSQPLSSSAKFGDASQLSVCTETVAWTAWPTARLGGASNSTSPKMLLEQRTPAATGRASLGDSYSPSDPAGLRMSVFACASNGVVRPAVRHGRAGGGAFTSSGNDNSNAQAVQRLLTGGACGATVWPADGRAAFRPSQQSAFKGIIAGYRPADSPQDNPSPANPPPPALLT